MTQETRELYQLLVAVLSEPEDTTRRNVLADWLEEHDEPELADEQRRFNLDGYQAEQRLRMVAKEFARGDYRGMLEGLLGGEFIFSSSDFRYEIDWNELWQDIEKVTRETVSPLIKRQSNFSCSC